MTLLGLILFLVIIGVVLWGAMQMPIPGWIKTIIQVIAIIAVVAYVAHFFGVAVPLLR